MTPAHYLRPLLMPASVALVGASSKPGSMGRIVMENLLGGAFHGALFAVNPNHRRVLGERSYASLSAIGKPVELALIAVPAAAVPAVIDGAAHAGVKAAVVLSAPPADPDDARRWHRELLDIAKARGIRVLGPHSFGVIRTDIGLNASLGTAVARPGRLALVAQSGAVCTAMLDFAASAGIGFSTVVALGGGMDVGFGELLDALLLDSDTDGILLYAETVGDARRFLSALRAAARTKPVVVLKAGRSMERAAAGRPSPDAVFDAAMTRAGTVRVKTYTQLFAAARILAMNRIARGDRLAIVTNGHGPGTLAADIAADRGIVLAEFSPETERALVGVLPPNVACRNPLNVRGDATPKRLAAAVAAVLSDPRVDAVLALHVARPATSATDAARALAAVARRTTKPVLGAWLGSIDRREADAALEAGGVANFFTPENAVEAFSFLAVYRRNQEWLLEVPPPQPEPQPPDLRAVERIRTDAASTHRQELTRSETHTLLATFGLPVAPAVRADTLNEALAAARRLGYPVSLRSDAAVEAPDPAPPVVYQRLRDGRMLTRAWAALLGGPAGARRRAAVIVRKERFFDASHEVAIGVHTDSVFGPVITLGAGRAAASHSGEHIVLLPPLNERLARDLVKGTHAAAALQDVGDVAVAVAALTRILVQVSAVVCALPWVRSLALDPVRLGEGRAEISGAHVTIDPWFKPTGRAYGHMAIHPYPIEKVADVTLPDGTRLHVRPIRPEDAELERAFVHGLSEETRYFRFFYQLHELTPAMLARFTQVDYDREMALVAVDEAGGAPAIIGVARYIISADEEAAEFAVVVADAWQRRGVARMLMTRLVACANARGLKRLEGTVLRSNHNMLKFTAAFGFATRDDPAEAEQLSVALDLG
jgi:acetyltransferase